MASIGLLKTPVRAGVGGCIDVNWFQGISVCPVPVRITLTSGLGTPFIVVNFAGRGKTDQFTFLCPFTDPYVNSGGFNLLVDVWAAYRAGVWTSSTTILVYGQNPAGAGVYTLAVSKSGLDTVFKNPAVPAFTAACPTTLLGTVTVTDTGGLSVV